MLPKIIKVMQFPWEYAQDLWLYLRSSGYSPFVDRRRRLFYKLIIETHTIEKGLSLPKRRPLFGREKIRFVMSALDAYDPSFSPLPATMALGALDAYLRFHEEAGIDDPFLVEVSAFLARWRNRLSVPWDGGVKPFDLADHPAGTEFLLSRSSLRMFDGRPLPLDTVRGLVQTAQSAPSQCNRQSSMVHLYQDRERIDTLLALQGGSRGFSERVGNLLVVTSELAAWGGAGQRNQPYVDGALFAMCILLACHARNIAACPLNLAVTNATERKIKAAGGIRKEERVVLMIAFGTTINEPLRVATSPRRDTDEILTIHPDTPA